MGAVHGEHGTVETTQSQNTKTDSEKVVRSPESCDAVTGDPAFGASESRKRRNRTCGRKDSENVHRKLLDRAEDVNPQNRKRRKPKAG